MIRLNRTSDARISQFDSTPIYHLNCVARARHPYYRCPSGMTAKAKRNGVLSRDTTIPPVNRRNPLFHTPSFPPTLDRSGPNRRIQLPLELVLTQPREIVQGPPEPVANIAAKSPRLYRRRRKPKNKPKRLTQSGHSLYSNCHDAV